jgi:GMP synthase-like glutamine amidotransferase
MRVHVVRHVPFEGPEIIAEWARQRAHSLTESFAITEEYPPAGDVDMLVVMGGPMDADDEVASPWLVAEKRYIAEAIDSGMRVLGVCLGAQILAEVLGGRVRRGDCLEVGWYPVALTDAGRADPVFSAFPEELVVGHWHGDTFDLPPSVAPTLSSEITPNQAFSAQEGRVVGLQCHLEWTPDAVEALLANCGDDLAGGGAWVADADEMRQGAHAHARTCHDALFALLDGVATQDAEA